MGTRGRREEVKGREKRELQHPMAASVLSMREMYGKRFRARCDEIAFAADQNLTEKVREFSLLATNARCNLIIIYLKMDYNLHVRARAHARKNLTYYIRG